MTLGHGAAVLDVTDVEEATRARDLADRNYAACMAQRQNAWRAGYRAAREEEPTITDGIPLPVTDPG